MRVQTGRARAASRRRRQRSRPTPMPPEPAAPREPLNAQLVARMRRQSVVRGQLLGDLSGERRVKPSADVNALQLRQFELGTAGQFPLLSREVGVLAIACELTETYSPAAIDIAPATNPATPATSTLLRLVSAAATPTMRLAVETMPSLAPRTAALSQPIRSVRCCSGFLIVSRVLRRLTRREISPERFRGASCSSSTF